MSEKIRDMKRRAYLARQEAFRSKRRFGLCDMADAYRMAADGYGREDIAHATHLSDERCREIVFGNREARA